MKATPSRKDRLSLLKKKEKEQNSTCIDNYTCADCAVGKPKDDVQWNLSLDGKPLTIRCPHYCNGKYGLLMRTPACIHFVKKSTQD